MSFKRSYSRVYYGSEELRYPSNSALNAVANRDYYHASGSNHNIAKITEESKNFERHARPGSLRSHDSGFNDSDQSPNTSTNSSHEPANNKLSYSPSNDHVSNLDESVADQSPSISSEATQTPPTVIRNKKSIFLPSPRVRRLSFNVSNSSTDDQLPRNISYFMEPASDKSGENSLGTRELSLNTCRSPSMSLHRSKAHDNSSCRRRRLLNCVSRVSDSVGDVYTLASGSPVLSLKERPNLERNEINHSYESLGELNRLVQQSKNESRYDYNESVIFSHNADSSLNDKTKLKRILPLPTYDELYPPNDSSTPKVSKSKKSQSDTNGTIRGGYPLSDGWNESDWNLSLSVTMNWETCTYIEYTNPHLNGHASSVQFWLDEIRSSFAHEILSTLQTKSILFEAARTYSINPAIASKLINHIQIKSIEIETSFENIERVFETHTKRLKRCQEADDIEIADNHFKEILSGEMKQLTANVCQFMRKLNSKVLFKSYNGVVSDSQKRFDLNVKTIIEMCQDLKVACDTKIDDIELACLLKDLLSIKRSILKAIRKVFRRLVGVISSAIESTENELMLRAYLNMIATFPAEGVYNSVERFSSLNDAFLSCGLIRIHLMICLTSAKISIRSLALRALAAICTSAGIIQQFLEIGGLDVITEIISDNKRNILKHEPELREALSVLTQVTAPWHHNINCTNIDDFIKSSVDSLVTRLTTVLSTTECAQTLMLCIACLNNLSRKSTLTFYSLMANETVHFIVRACERHQQYPSNLEFTTSIIFLYVSCAI